MKRTSFLLIIGILTVLLVGAFAGYQFWQKSVNVREIKKVEKTLEEVKKEALKYENLQVAKAVSAKQTVAQIKADMIIWSQVIKDVKTTIPKRKGRPIVYVLSYSGSKSSGVSMNVKTLPDSEDVFGDVADLIKNFDESDLFAETFVPSISIGKDDEGKPILTFAFSAKYVGEPDLEAALGEILEDSLEETEVPETEVPETGLVTEEDLEIITEETSEVPVIR